jgi:hypothetical protein
MSEQGEATYFHVDEVGPVDGPVGMDIGIWLNFETDQGRIRLKLSHDDAAKLRNALKQEESLSTEG